MGIRECSNRSNWGRLRNNDKLEEFVFISANSSNVYILQFNIDQEVYITTIANL